MSVRDPRTDPRPGDVFRKGAKTRKVLCRMWGSLRLIIWYEGPEKSGRGSLDSFARWCRGAEVVRIADPAKEGSENG